MKAIVVLAGLIVAQPLFAAPPQTADPVVREYVTNASFTDWSLQGGWAWTNGVLTHYSGAPGIAEQISMPTIDVGRLYRITVAITGRTQGGVSVGLGKGLGFAFNRDGGWVEDGVATDPLAALKITTTADFDGSIAAISIRQFGDEMMDDTGWVLGDNWSQDKNRLRHTPGSAVSLDRPIAGLVEGHSYLLTFHVAEPPDGASLLGNGLVRVGGKAVGWFSQHGGPNFSWEFKAGADNMLSFFPDESVDGTHGFNGILTNISVRELTSDPAPSQPPTFTQQ